jgi:hypothetical protein
MRKLSKTKLAKLAARALVGQPKPTRVIVNVKKKNQRQRVTLREHEYSAPANDDFDPFQGMDDASDYL